VCNEFNLEGVPITDPRKARVRHRIVLFVVRDGRCHSLNKVRGPVDGFGVTDDADTND